MEFTWDEEKSRRNEVERGLPFRIAPAMFEGPTVEMIDERFDYGEERIISMGQVGASVLVCVYTEHGDVRRIISLRAATRRECDEYFRTDYED